MYKIKVTPSSRKISMDEYNKYISVRDLLKAFNKKKDDVPPEMRNVHYASDEMKKYLRDFRKDQKLSRTNYIVSYEIQNRVWKKLIGNVEFKFDLNSIQSKSIMNNARHLKFHKGAISNQKTRMEHLKQFKQSIREKYQQARLQARQVRVVQRAKTIRAIGLNIAYEKCGGVIYKRLRPTFGRGVSPKGYISNEMGVFMRFLKSKDKQIVFQEKKPQTKDNYIGVELEFFCDLNSEDLSFKLYEVGLGKHVYLKTDGSIRAENNMFPHELCILAKEKEVQSVIDDVSKVLLESNAKVNKSCGMHVHIDMRSRDHEIAFHNLVSSQNILFAMNPFSRQSGTYCRRVDTKDFKKASSGARYFGINATAHPKHHTIEIRIHSGTVQAPKINNWIKLLLLIVSKKEMVKRASPTLRAFLKQYDIEGGLGDYVAERMAKFTGEDKKNVEERGAA